MDRQKYRLNYAESSHGFGFTSEKKEYEVGESVAVVYNAVMTDTSYSFDINADDVKMDYGSVIRITFTMPDHDVDIKCQSRYVMGYRSEENTDRMGMLQRTFADQYINMQSEKGEGAIIRTADKYCRECGAKLIENAKFCGECGKLVTGSVTAKDSARFDKEKNDITPVGWTCGICGRKNQTGDKCDACGEEIRKEILFSCSSYASTNPPRSESVRVYEFSDSKLICEHTSNGQSSYQYISADVIAPAYEIIKKYGIDKWKEYENRMSGIMGGSVSVFYKDGNEFVGTSMDHMGSVVNSAYHELTALFCGR